MLFFLMGVSPKRSIASEKNPAQMRFVQGDATTSNACGEPNGRHARIGLGGMWQHGNGRGVLQNVSCTNRKMISNDFHSAKQHSWMEYGTF